MSRICLYVLYLLQNCNILTAREEPAQNCLRRQRGTASETKRYSATYSCNVCFLAAIYRLVQPGHEKEQMQMQIKLYAFRCLVVSRCSGLP
ncbi:hypothetical protein FOXYSP1_04069 [Fusarium oxysporum f. sp. phaseoli]